MKPFTFEGQDFIGLIDYRIACCEADEEGTVLCDGEVYPVNRYGVMPTEPLVLREWSDKVSQILLMQSAKRKKERALGRPAP